MNPAAPAPTPVPIHDIVGPIWFLPWPLWMVVVAVLGLLVVLIAVGWALRTWMLRKKPPTARERAIAALESLRGSISGADPYAFGILVSDAIRRYVREQHGLDAPTQTSLEFLEGIRRNPILTDNEKAGLSVLLERTDLLKFARESAGESELIGLLETAGRIVRAEVQPGREKEGAQ